MKPTTEQMKAAAEEYGKSQYCQSIQREAAQHDHLAGQICFRDSEAVRGLVEALKYYSGLKAYDNVVDELLVGDRSKALKALRAFGEDA